MASLSSPNAPIPEDNFFAQYYQSDVDTLSQAPRPNFSERFYMNMEAATRQGTMVGSLRDVSRPENRHRFDSRFGSFPEWETPMEGLAALTGQIAGTMFDAERGAPHLENLIPIGIGEKAVVWSGRSLSALRARLFAGAIDATVTNAVTDPVIQGIEMGAGFRDEFDPIQFASSVALGAVAGGVMGPITHRASSPESHIAGEIADWADDPALAMPARQADMLDTAVRSDPMDTPRMKPDLPDGEKLDFGETGVNPKPKSSVAASESISEPVSLGDRLQPKPSKPEVQAMARQADAEPLWKDNGAWKETDPDIIEIGQFGPVIDIEAHGKDWNSVSSRLKQMEAGEARGALDHPDIGDIDVVWGNYDPVADKGFGLKKIFNKHPEMMSKLPEIVRESRVYDQNANRIRLVYGDDISVISLNWKGDQKVWLLTAYEDVKGLTRIKSQRSSDTMARARGRQGDTSSSSLANNNVAQKDIQRFQ